MTNGETHSFHHHDKYDRFAKPFGKKRHWWANICKFSPISQPFIPWWIPQNSPGTARSFPNETSMMNGIHSGSYDRILLVCINLSIEVCSIPKSNSEKNRNNELDSTASPFPCPTDPKWLLPITASFGVFLPSHTFFFFLSRWRIWNLSILIFYSDWNEWFFFIFKIFITVLEPIWPTRYGNWTHPQRQKGPRPTNFFLSIQNSVSSGDVSLFEPTILHHFHYCSATR